MVRLRTENKEIVINGGMNWGHASRVDKDAAAGRHAVMHASLRACIDPSMLAPRQARDAEHLQENGRPVAADGLRLDVPVSIAHGTAPA